MEGPDWFWAKVIGDTVLTPSLEFSVYAMTDIRRGYHADPHPPERTGGGDGKSLMGAWIMSRTTSMIMAT